MKKKKALEEQIKKEEMATSGVFMDSRDGRNYKWMKLKDGKRWMSENLKYDAFDSQCYNDRASNCRIYGRLYHLDMLKSICPDGWRVPSRKEWKKLIEVYNGGRASYPQLVEGGKTGLDLKLGGYQHNHYGGLGMNELGYYWSSSSFGSQSNYVFNIDGDRKELGAWVPIESNKKASCRCIKD